MSRSRSRTFRIVRLLLAAGSAAFLLAVLGVGAAYLYVRPNLPDIESLRDVRLQVPLRVFSRDGALLAEFGDKRRRPVRYSDVPPRMIHAFLAAEDDRFFQHPGVDWQGLTRAALHLLRTGEKGQGGSTITMQVARNFFLSREKTYLRKLNEIFLALKIENELGKEEILELYLNKIYLGHRAYGVQAAAEVYYGTDIGHLDLAQTATIAGLPKAPSSLNPVTSPARAMARRNYVLRRMYELGYIDRADYDQARTAPVTAALHARPVEVPAPYLAEMVRAHMVERFGEAAYTEGYRVHTTILAEEQRAATRAVRHALLAYERRHGFRGPLQHLDPAAPDVLERLRAVPAVGGLVPALVVEVGGRTAALTLATGDTVTLGWEGMSWARPRLPDGRTGPRPGKATDILSPGDVVYLERTGSAGSREGETGWSLAQVPEVSGALVALDPRDGAIQALVGGFDFRHSKFNRAVQARRQPGSSFKPFIYSAALAQGYTPASIINDAPVVFDDPALENTWRPENYSGRFYGPTRLREALVHSRNLVSIRLLRAIGVDYAVNYLGRFGFDPAHLPRNLSLALGSGSVSPLQLAAAYAVFANGGFRVEPYFIARIEDRDGNVLQEAAPRVACPECERVEAAAGAAPRGPGTPAEAVETAAEATGEAGAPATPAAEAPGMEAPSPSGADASLPPPERRAPRVISAQNAYLVASMMRDVIRRGTGRRALTLGRGDLAGKTGTTNDQRDAWFSGFNPDLVVTAWVGYDRLQPLGERETGGRAALPMWIEFMQTALAGVPERPFEQPPGLVTVRIDPETGLLASVHTANPVFEIFPSDRVPPPAPEPPGSEEGPKESDEAELTGQIF